MSNWNTLTEKHMTHKYKVSVVFLTCEKLNLSKARKQNWKDSILQHIRLYKINCTAKFDYFMAEKLDVNKRIQWKI